jgi:hypothetical protein
MSDLGRRDAPAALIPDSVEEILGALEGTEVLKALQVTTEDLHVVRSDSDVQETLRIAYEILAALRENKVVEIFDGLPVGDQANFLRWIGSTADPELRASRTATFVSALQLSPSPIHSL